MSRIENHPVLGPPTGEPITIWVDDEEVGARSTDTVAAALWAAGRRVLRYSRTGEARGLYCGIGHCYECRVSIGDTSGVRACLAPVTPGMRIRTDGDR